MRPTLALVVVLLAAGCATASNSASGSAPARDWEGRPTYVVGATSPSDTTSPQFWVDRERLIVVRFLMPLFPSPENSNQDVRLENNMRLGGGWLATRVRILDRGVALQTEDNVEALQCHTIGRWARSAAFSSPPW
jgi:hypothetical protein